MAICTEYSWTIFIASSSLCRTSSEIRLYVEHCNELLKLITKLCNANRCKCILARRLFQNVKVFIPKLLIQKPNSHEKKTQIFYTVIFIMENL